QGQKTPINHLNGQHDSPQRCPKPNKPPNVSKDWPQSSVKTSSGERGRARRASNPSSKRPIPNRPPEPIRSINRKPVSGDYDDSELRCGEDSRQDETKGVAFESRSGAYSST